MSVKKILGFLVVVSVIAMLVVTPLGVAAAGDDVEIDMGDVVFDPGDIDGDGNVNLNDLVTIACVAAEWDVAHVEAALDVDGSTEFDLDDVNYLAKHLAGWEDFAVLSDIAYIPA